MELFPSENINDDKLLIDAAKLNMADFSKLYNKYYVSIFRFVYRRVDNEDIALDLVSQTFLNAMNNLLTYKDKGVLFESWLITIARNEVNMYYRKLNKERIFYLNMESENQLFEELGDSKGRDEYELLSPLLETLSSNELEFIEMKYFEKRSYKEISKIVGISEGNIKVKVHRIIQKLKLKSMQIREIEIGICLLAFTLI